ncbi:MAG: M48 family metallopeptidase [Steroidobacteraceae bacterium]|nr:M48 family metallopeptidase [Steroidobacteraceae bacterium]
MDFYARQEAARRTTRWLLFAFLASVALVVLAISGVVYVVIGMKAEPGESASGPAVLAGVITALVILGASLFKTMSLRAGGGVVARSLGGTRIERGTNDLALRRLHNVVEEMSIASGVSMPELYVLEAEDGINAFAAGNSAADAAVAVTRGAITRLNREELQGVIAHEFSHVLNGDMRLNSRLLGWVFGLLVVAIAMRIFLQGAGGRSSRRDGKGGALILIAVAVMAIGYIGVFVGRLLQAAVSRHRERLADASAVQFTRNPQGLVGALLKIAGVPSGSKIESPAKDEVAHMLFAPGMARWFSTHPPLSERVRELDASIARENFDALTAAAARDAEQVRLSPQFNDVAGLAPRGGVSAPSVSAPDAATATPVEINTAPVRVASLAGTFDETQQRYAHEARLAIPEGLHSFADSPDAARVLLFALLRGADDAVAARQDEAIRGGYGDAMLARIHETLPVAGTLPPELRLPAVQQLLPALRRMTVPERRELRSVAQQFALTDDRIDVFECCLTLLLEAALRSDLELEDEHGSQSLLSCAADVSRLFAVLAAHGTDDPEAARRAYQAGMKHALPSDPAPYSVIPRWPDALRESLRALNSLRPFAKKVLIEGLVRTVALDRRLSVDEGELLRTVCATLHCPLPPILAARS